MSTERFSYLGKFVFEEGAGPGLNILVIREFGEVRFVGEGVDHAGYAETPASVGGSAQRWPGWMARREGMRRIDMNRRKLALRLMALTLLPVLLLATGGVLSQSLLAEPGD